MKNLWMNEVARSALQTRYYGECRYADYPRAIADMCADITIPDDRSIETCTTDITSECLGRYMNGRTCKTTGAYYYTIPTSEKMALIDNYRGELPIVLSTPHSGDMEEAIRSGYTNGFDRIADQTLFAGAFRGTFFTEIVTDDGLDQVLMEVHLLENEPYFRVRIILVSYVRYGLESFNDLDGRADRGEWDEYDGYDLFAVTGTNEGKLFIVGLADHCGDLMEIGNYKFFEKGRRILALDLKVDEEETVRMKLITTPDEINRAYKVLNSAPC